MEKYEPLGVVGEGSYGVVLKCKCRDNGKTVAIKKFIDSEDDQNVRKIALREIRVLRKLRHENLVNLIEVFRRRKHIYLVFEFIDHTLLDELEQKSHGLDEETCRKYIYQVLRGLNFCHENNIIHRDVKPENVLVSKNGIIKLADFGFARNMVGPGEVFTDYVATRWYRAPELLVGDIAYGKEVDVWALGCLFAEMMTGEPLFPGDSDIDQLFLIAQCLGRLSKRHLNIMQRNSAFRGFQFPDTQSRHGSTASTSSTNSKISKFMGGGGVSSDRRDSKLAPPTMDNSNEERIFSGGNGNILGSKHYTINENGNSKIGSGSLSGSSGSRKKRYISLERSVFASMFPSWADETVQFLTLCLDPEPSGRPSCNSLMRVPYFTHDNFPAKFIPELNAKLQLEGGAPISAFSTKKKRFVSNVTTSGNVSSSLSPTSRGSMNPSNLQPKNPLYQTRSNLSQLEDNEPLSLTNFSLSQADNKSSARIQMQSSNMINFQNSNSNLQSQNTFQQQQQQLNNHHQHNSSKYLGSRDHQQHPTSSSTSLFQLDRLSKDKTSSILSNNTPTSRKPSFSINNESSLANSGENSKIPVLLSRKYSDDSLISSTGTLSSSGSPQNPTSKSTPNIAEETTTATPTTGSGRATTNSVFSHVNNSIPSNPSILQQTKEKRFSIQISTPLTPLILQNPSYQPFPTAAVPKKYSFSFPPPNSMSSGGTGGENGTSTTEERKTPPDTSPTKHQSSQLPVTTLTFSMNTSGVSFSQSLAKSPGNVSQSGPGGNSGYTNSSSGNQTFSMYQKRSSPTTLTKPSKTFSINNSSYFPQPMGYSGGSGGGNVNGNGGGGGGGTNQSNLASPYSTQNTFTYQNSMGNSKSLPVTIFGSSMLKNSNNVNNNSGILTSVAESFLPRMTGKNNKTLVNKTSNDENVIGSLLTGGSPPKHGNSALMRKREKWDQQTQNARKFSVFTTNNDGN